MQGVLRIRRDSLISKDRKLNIGQVFKRAIAHGDMAMVVLGSSGLANDEWSYKVVASWNEANSFDDRDKDDQDAFKGSALLQYEFDAESRIYFSSRLHIHYLYRCF